MRSGSILTLALIVGTVGIVGNAAAEPAPPHVIDMTPANGAKDVAPGPCEIRITFSEPMADRSWSITGGGPNFPKILGIAYEKDCTVLVVKVVLEPNRKYRFGLNAPSHMNFRSRAGVPLAPILVRFETADGPETATDDPPPEEAPTVEFDLEDVHGVRVTSQDYRGVPIFLAFGAAW